MACVYEVNVLVDDAAKDEFLNFLEAPGGHVEQLLEISGFKSAEVFLPMDEATPEGKTSVTAVYRLESKDALQSYFDNQATAMRAETMRLFEGRISATRRIMGSHKEW